MDFNEIFSRAGRGLRNKRLDFRGNLVHDPNPGIFLKDVFVLFTITISINSQK